MSHLSNSSDLRPDSDKMFSDISTDFSITTADKPFDKSLENDIQAFLTGLRSFEQDIDNLESERSHSVSHNKQLVPETDAYKHHSQDNAGKEATIESLTPQQANELQQNGLNLTRLSDMPRLTNNSDVKPDTDQTSDVISTGSYRKFPTMKHLINEYYQQTSDKPVYSFPETNTQALITGLRTFQKQMDNLESELSQAMRHNKQLVSETDAYKHHSQDKAELQQDGFNLTRLSDMPSLTDTSDVKPDSDQTSDVISTGSYRKLPTRKHLINEYYQQTSDKPVYSFPETNTQALMTCLRTLEQQMENFESEHRHDNQLVSKTDAYKHHSQDKADLISSVARTESRCILLEKNLKQMKQLALNAERNKANIQQELEGQRSSEALALRQSSAYQVSLDQITGLEREVLQLSIIQNVAEQRIKLLEQALMREKKRKKILQEKAFKSITQCDGVDINVQNVFAFMESHNTFLDSSANNKQLTTATPDNIASSSFLNCNNLQDLFVQLQKEFCQLTWKHQNLTQLYNETCDSRLREDVEIEIDNLVTQMEIKAMQMVKIRKTLYTSKNETKPEKRKKKEKGQPQCKSKTAFSGDNLRTLKRAGRVVPQTGTENVGRKPDPSLKDTRKLQASLRQDDLSWV